KLKGSDDIDWVDVATANDEALGPDLTPGLAQRRFHVRDKDGQLASGASAFAQLWIALPSTSWLGRFTALPGVRQVADVAYVGFLAIRPFIQRMMPR
ncbi:MAG: DCC1-like thiol-disulfide oxidoreductase family protein, partial [Pseudomonadota bacterium]